MNKTKIKILIKEILSTLGEINQPIGININNLKHSECPRCKNKSSILKSTDPITWQCDKCKHRWPNDCPECGGKGYTDSMDGDIRCGTCRDLKEEHGDVHYWGKQPTNPALGTKITTGYKGTKPKPLKEDTIGDAATNSEIFGKSSAKPVKIPTKLHQQLLTLGQELGRDYKGTTTDDLFINAALFWFVTREKTNIFDTLNKEIGNA